MGHVELAALHVEVVFSAAARQVTCMALVLPAASTVHDALRASGLGAGVAKALVDGDPALHFSVWGRRCELTQLLRDGDRVECCRALTVDPKQARRLRYQAQRQKRDADRAVKQAAAQQPAAKAKSTGA
jgi:uncharacterized protein